MKQQDLVRGLSKRIASAIRSAKFCVSGALPPVDPRIEVVGCGPLELPLNPAVAKRLRKACRQAPYGQGTQTLVNTRIRNAFELDPTRFSITNRQWNDTIDGMLRSIAEDLGLPADALEAALYKLLFYEPGGFFKPHRDSEKEERMVASLIVALPSRFDGGELLVRHKGFEQRVDFKEAAAGRFPCYAAFYADCEHELQRVHYGARLCLAYNLVLRAPARQKRAAPAAKDNGPARKLAASITSWVKQQKSEPLVFALEHHYTQRGLARDLLKGNDRATADLVASAAELAGCHAYLCQVERHVCQDAHRDDWEDRWGFCDSAPDDVELGEVIDEDLAGKEWFNLGGKQQRFPEIGLSLAAIIADTPIDEWQPTREEYEGFTGNAGNTLDRWYHRSALCVWHRDQHFDIIAGGGAAPAIEMLQGMVAKLKRTPKRRWDEARGDCLRLARAIISRWPQIYHYPPLQGRNEAMSIFPKLVAELDDPEITGELFRSAAAKDQTLDISKLVLASCRRHGCSAFGDALTSLLERGESGPSIRDASWLDQLARAAFDDPEKGPLVSKLAKLATARFCRPRSEGRSFREAPADPEQVLPLLLRVLLISGETAALEELIQFVRSLPERFSVEKVQVPSLEQASGWLREKSEPVPPVLVEWLRALQDELSSATAQAPQPPTDWARPAEITCTCQFCRELNGILRDPNAETGLVRAREDARSHLSNMVHKHQCDVTYKLEKSGSPYAFVFKKTNGSFDRRRVRYASDQKLLAKVTDLLE